MSGWELELRIVQHISRRYTGYKSGDMVEIMKELGMVVSENGMPKNSTELRAVISRVDKKAKEIGLRKIKRNIEYKINVKELPNHSYCWQIIERRIDNKWCNAGLGVTEDKKSAFINAVDFAERILAV